MDVFTREIVGRSNAQAVTFALLSDLHLDASDHDDEALTADLDAAKSIGARISINGDIFDAIVPSDRKRHHPSVSRADPDRDDIFNQLVEGGVNRLAPVADLIDVISPGNHERSVLKYHHIDLVSMLVYGLNQRRDPKLPPIHQGSYRGYQRYVFKWESGNSCIQFVVFRHHGTGGAAPVTGGSLDLDRIRKDFDADLYWIGHKHSGISRPFTRVSLGSQGRLRVRQQRGVMSAGYKRQFSLESPEHNGDIADFGEQFYQLSQTGAQWVYVEAHRKALTNSSGWRDGLRWTVADSPAVLLRTA